MKKHFLAYYIVSILVGASVGWNYADYQANQIDPLNDMGNQFLNEEGRISLTITVEYQHSENASLIFPPLVSSDGQTFFSNFSSSYFSHRGNLIDENSSLLINLNSSNNASANSIGLMNPISIYRSGFDKNFSQITINSIIAMVDWDGNSFDWFFEGELLLNVENLSFSTNQIKITGYMVAEQINDTCVWQFSSGYFNSSSIHLPNPELVTSDGYGHCKEAES